MTDFFAWFREKYRAEFPIPLAMPLAKVGPLVWTSLEKLEHPPMVPEFYEGPDYLIAGEWGRGVNSYAFYFVEKRGTHRRFFRIFSGGVYGKPDDDLRSVVEYLAGYEAWRKRFEPELAESTLVCNMGSNTAELAKSTGQRLTHQGFEEGSAWWDALSPRMP